METTPQTGSLLGNTLFPLSPQKYHLFSPCAPATATIVCGKTSTPPSIAPSNPPSNPSSNPSPEIPVRLLEQSKDTAPLSSASDAYRAKRMKMGVRTPTTEKNAFSFHHPSLPKTTHNIPPSPRKFPNISLSPIFPRTLLSSPVVSVQKLSLICDNKDDEEEKRNHIHTTEDQRARKLSFSELAWKSGNTSVSGQEQNLLEGGENSFPNIEKLTRVPSSAISHLYSPVSTLFPRKESHVDIAAVTPSSEGISLLGPTSQPFPNALKPLDSPLVHDLQHNDHIMADSIRAPNATIPATPLNTSFPPPRSRRTPLRRNKPPHAEGSRGSTGAHAQADAKSTLAGTQGQPEASSNTATDSSSSQESGLRHTATVQPPLSRRHSQSMPTLTLSASDDTTQAPIGDTEGSVLRRTPHGCDIVLSPYAAPISPYRAPMRDHASNSLSYAASHSPYTTSRSPYMASSRTTMWRNARSPIHGGGGSCGGNSGNRNHRGQTYRRDRGGDRYDDNDHEEALRELGREDGHACSEEARLPVGASGEGDEEGLSGGRARGGMGIFGGRGNNSRLRIRIRTGTVTDAGMGMDRGSGHVGGKGMGKAPAFAAVNYDIEGYHHTPSRQLGSLRTLTTSDGARSPCTDAMRQQCSGSAEVDDDRERLDGEDEEAAYTHHYSQSQSQARSHRNEQSREPPRPDSRQEGDRAARNIASHDVGGVGYKEGDQLPNSHDALWQQQLSHCYDHLPYDDTAEHPLTLALPLPLPNSTTSPSLAGRAFANDSSPHCATNAYTHTACYPGGGQGMGRGLRLERGFGDDLEDDYTHTPMHGSCIPSATQGPFGRRTGRHESTAVDEIDSMQIANGCTIGGDASIVTSLVGVQPYTGLSSVGPGNAGCGGATTGKGRVVRDPGLSMGTGMGMGIAMGEDLHASGRGAGMNSHIRAGGREACTARGGCAGREGDGDAEGGGANGNANVRERAGMHVDAGDGDTHAQEMYPQGDMDSSTPTTAPYSSSREPGAEYGYAYRPRHGSGYISASMPLCTPNHTADPAVGQTVGHGAEAMGEEGSGLSVSMGMGMGVDMGVGMGIGRGGPGPDNGSDQYGHADYMSVTDSNHVSHRYDAILPPIDKQDGNNGSFPYNYSGNHASGQMHSYPYSYSHDLPSSLNHLSSTPASISASLSTSGVGVGNSYNGKQGSQPLDNPSNGYIEPLPTLPSKMHGIVIYDDSNPGMIVRSDGTIGTYYGSLSGLSDPKNKKKRGRKAKQEAKWDGRRDGGAMDMLQPYYAGMDTSKGTRGAGSGMDLSTGVGTGVGTSIGDDTDIGYNGVGLSSGNGAVGASNPYYSLSSSSFTTDNSSSTLPLPPLPPLPPLHVPPVSAHTPQHSSSLPLPPLTGMSASSPIPAIPSSTDGEMSSDLRYVGYGAADPSAHSPLQQPHPGIGKDSLGNPVDMGVIPGLWNAFPISQSNTYSRDASLNSTDVNSSHGHPHDTALGMGIGVSMGVGADMGIAVPSMEDMRRTSNSLSYEAYSHDTGQVYPSIGTSGMWPYEHPENENSEGLVWPGDDDPAFDHSVPTSPPVVLVGGGGTRNAKSAVAVQLTPELQALIAQTLHPSRKRSTPTGETVCVECKRDFRSPALLRKHARTHVHKKQFPCPLCALSFSERANLKRHVKHMHLQQRDFACPVPGCTQAFSRKSHLVHHLSGTRHDSNIVRVSCDEGLWALVTENSMRKRRR